MSAATSFYAAFRPLFRQIGRWCTGIRSETTAAIGLEILDLLGLRDQLAIAVYYRHIVRKRESGIAA